MAKVIIETKDRRVAYKDAQGMLVTPYSKGENGWVLEDETYDIFAIVGDTLSITQDEESTDETPHEFSDENLEENTSLGNLNFTAECTDYQDAVLKKVYGFTEKNGILLAPSEYKDRYVLIQILFDPELGQNNVVLPFVKLNGRPAFESMRSGTARGNISGIAKTRDVLTVADATDMPKTYAKSDVDKCPMAFIPSGHALMVSSGGKMTYVKPEDGSQADATLSDS